MQNDNTTIDRLSHTYLVVRSMQLAAVATAGEHFSRHVDFPGYAREPWADPPDADGRILIRVDATTLCTDALQDRPGERELDTLERIRAAGYDTAPVLDSLRPLSDTQDALVSQMAGLMGDDLDALYQALDEYCRHADAAGVGSPVIPSTEWTRDVAAE